MVQRKDPKITTLALTVCKLDKDDLVIYLNRLQNGPNFCKVPRPPCLAGLLYLSLPRELSLACKLASLPQQAGPVTRKIEVITRVEELWHLANFSNSFLIGNDQSFASFAL